MALKVVRHRPLFYMLFGFAVAALAAAVGDVVVETLSNRGTFGPGRFTDGSNADVLPVVALGALLLFGFLGYCIRRRSVKTLSFAAALRIVPAIYIAQIALLWSMETLEQLLVVGHWFGGGVWLGGPVLVSLAAHALICALVTVLALAFIRFLEPRALRVIRALRAIAVRPLVPALSTAFEERPVHAVRKPSIERRAKRGPPLPSV
jgi:hypothetical protein